MGVIYTVLGIISVLSGIISTLLNPISFYYHLIKRSTTSARLYCLLAAADFATNLIFPFFLAYRFLSDRPQENNGFRSISTTERVMSALFYAPGYISGVIVSTIAIARFIAVKYPLYIVRSKPLFSYLLAVFLFYSAASLLKIFSQAFKWCPLKFYAYPSSPVNKIISVFEIMSYMGISSIGSILSIGTIILVLIRKVQRKSLTQNTVSANNTDIIRDGIRISSMIVFANIIAPILQIISISGEIKCKNNNSFWTIIIILSFSVCTIISSALDPLIVILFSGEIKRFLKEKIFGK